jgi:hypothetical protein
MKTEITRNVVRDLWALCQSGDVSADSRALVDAYLATDTEFAATLKETAKMNTLIPGVTLSPDAERRMLDEARDQARIKLLLVGGGLAILLLALCGALVLIFRAS